MSFSNIKSFIKENWAALVTFLLGFGQLYLFTCFLQQIAHLSKHSDKVNNTFKKKKKDYEQLLVTS